MVLRRSKLLTTPDTSGGRSSASSVSFAMPPKITGASGANS